MAKIRFSIIMPVHYSEVIGQNRIETSIRAIKSIVNQQYDNWELIIVDDDSDPRLKEELNKYIDGKKIRYIWQPPGNRAIARNNGMDDAKGEWLCWLDSDDEYSSHYLRACDYAIRTFPDYKIFNFASIIQHPDFQTIIRPAFKPPEEGAGHVWFRAGGIATGSFIFRRDLWASDPKYRIPDAGSPYQFAADSGFDMKLVPGEDAYTKIGDNPEGAFTDGVLRIGYSLGNPWGDDFIQFYKLTRDNHSKPLDMALYVQYPRDSEDRYGKS